MYSIVIPCYKSSHTIRQVVAETSAKMNELGRTPFEFVLVDDCSPDDGATVRELHKICEDFDNITVIELAINSGQHNAMMAGLNYASGDAIISMDDDMQTHPSQLPVLFEEFDKGYDVVYGYYKDKKHSGFRNFGSRVNDYMLRVMLSKPKELFVSSYFAVRRFIVDDMIRYENSYPYVIGLVLRSAGKIANVDIDHRERMEGSSGYTLKKLLNLWFNGFTAFSVKPLRIATFIGGVSAVIGLLYGLFVIIRRLLFPDAGVMGFAALMSAIVFFGGMILLTLGLIGEYIGRMYISMNNSPQYVIRDRWNIEK